MFCAGGRARRVWGEGGGSWGGKLPPVYIHDSATITLSTDKLCQENLLKLSIFGGGGAAAAAPPESSSSRAPESPIRYRHRAGDGVGDDPTFVHVFPQRAPQGNLPPRR
jgi:hypothetical protein